MYQILEIQLCMLLMMGEDTTRNMYSSFPEINCVMLNFLGNISKGGII